MNRPGIHYDMIPFPITPNNFLKLWQQKRNEFIKTHTRKINRMFNIVDEKGIPFKLIIRRGQPHLIPKINTPSLKHINDEVKQLMTIPPEIEFFSNRLRSVEASLDRILKKLDMPLVEKDLEIISESLYTPEQKINKESHEKREQYLKDYNKGKLIEQTNKELYALGMVPLPKINIRN